MKEEMWFWEYRSKWFENSKQKKEMRTYTIIYRNRQWEKFNQLSSTGVESDTEQGTEFQITKMSFLYLLRTENRTTEK